MNITILLSAILVFPHLMMTTQATLADVMPKSGEIQGWARHRSMQHFAGEDLYEYIDGGAEIYHEYGFVQVLVQDYINDEEKSVSVEVFEMKSPESAYGMYTFKTDAKGKRVPVGNDAQLADYYMNFWKGSYLVTLTGFDETEGTRHGLLDIAAKVSSKMASGGAKPQIASFFPEGDLTDQSLKYFKGYLGLRSSHPLFSLNITGYEEGIKGDYAGGFSLFLFRFKDEQGSRRVCQSMEGQEDRRGRRFFVAVQGKYLLLVLGEVDSVRAAQVFDDASKKIKE